MYEQLSSLALFGAVFFLTINEKKRVKNYITPFTVTAWPFAIIDVLVNFFLTDLGFYPVTERVIFFIIINLLIIWLIGYLFSSFSQNRSRTTSISDVFSNYRKYNTLLYIISWISIVLTFIQVFALIKANGGIWFLGSREFEDQMAGGYASHMIQLSRACFILLVFINLNKNKNPVYTFTLFFLMLSAVANQVKYPFIWIVLIVFFFIYIYKPVRVQLLGIIKLSFIISIIFLALMSIVFLSWDLSNANISEYLFLQFTNYIVSGPIVLDKWLDFANVKPDFSLFLVYKNFVNVIFGNPIRFLALDHVNLDFFPIGKGYPSNIGTSFGVYYIIGGLPFTFFITAVLSTIKYFIYFKSFKTMNPFIIFYNLFLLTISALSFFGEYMPLLSFWEIPLIIGIIILLFKFLEILSENHNQDKLLLSDAEKKV